MPSDLTADDIRGTTFDASLRGYDRAEVDAYLGRVADVVASLEARIALLEGKLGQLGLDEVPDLTVEFEKVGSDIAAILAEAERTATDLRERAAADAERWRAEAAAEAAEVRAAAQQIAEEMRRSSWQEATAMLQQAEEQTRQAAAEAEQEALFLRAQAEREVANLSRDARQEAEKLVRAARNEASQIALEARAESESVLEAAKRSAETAQERTLALEARRSELMDELEAARRSISDLSVAGGASAPEPAADTPADGTMPVWEDDDGSVKVLPAGSGFVAGPVDADEMMAEVERLRSGTADDHAAEPLEEELEPAVDPDDAGVPPEVEASAEVGEAAGPDGAEEADTAGDTPKAGAGPPPEVESDAALSSEATPAESEGGPAGDTTGEPEPEAGPTPGDETDGDLEVEPDPEPKPDELQGLFASLRTSTADPTPDAAPVEAGDPPQAVTARASAEVDASATGDSPANAPATEEIAPEQDDDSGGATFLQPSAQEAFELRDRMLLPVQNRVLRDLKRQIVDLQNGALEALRIGDSSWRPDADGYAAALYPGLRALIHDSFNAGAAAAGELAGARPPSVSGRPGATQPSAFVQPMLAELEAAHTSAGADAGVRERSAAVSRVFRSWRTDHAERRLRFVAFGAYHEGIVAGLAKLGVASVTAVTEGRMCAECPAAVDTSWDPAEGWPAGFTLPPAHPECVTTVVPQSPAAG